MSNVNQIMNIIKEEISSSQPSSSRIITHLCDLRTKEEYQSLSDSEFYDIVGETFKLNPEFFMNHIYREMLYLQSRGRKLYEKINKMEMEKFIIEKFCLYEGEQILYECNGKITQKYKVQVEVYDGNLFITNYRIIAQGDLLVEGGRIGSLLLAVVTGHSKRAGAKEDTIEASANQELSCYGYQFPIENIYNLKKKHKIITYHVKEGTLPGSIRIEPYGIYKAIREEDINRLFEILSKEVVF